MLIRRQLRSIPSGAPVVGAAVELRLEADNTIIASTTTDGNGWYQFQMHGNPGPYYILSSYGAETQRTSSKVVGLSGTTDIGSIPHTFRNWKNGYIDNILGELAVTASGAGMSVTVASGVHLTQGIIYDQSDAVSLPIAAAATQPRIDRVVVEVIPTGAGENIEGKSRLVVKQGTAAATPVAPALTQTTTLWQESLAQVRVDASVVAIASNKVTDERVAAWVSIPANSITTAMLQNLSVTGDKLAVSSVTTDKVANGTVLNTKMSTEALRSDAENLRILQADTDSDRPEWLHVKLAQLSDVNNVVPTSGQALIWNGSAWVPGDVSGTGSIGTRQSQYSDTNFNATGTLSGTRTLGSASVTLTSGSWLVETQLHFTARGGPGTITASLSGSGAPSGTDASSRIFEVDGVRQIILTGRRIVNPTTSTTFTTTASVLHQSGSTSDIRSGVVYVVATPR